MALKRFIVPFVLCSAWNIAFAAAANPNQGGCWAVRGASVLTSSMAVGQGLNAYSRANFAAVLLSQSYQTSVVCTTTVWTKGLDSLGYFSPDSAGSDTTALNLEGYVGQTVQIGVFFTGTTADTLFITVEQSLRYDKMLKDSSSFSFGFVTTDTLFVDSLETSLDQFRVKLVSVAGSASRAYTDAFTLRAPAMRLKIVNKGSQVWKRNKMFIELYCRHTDTIMGGVSGRLIEQKPNLPGFVR